MNDIVESMIEGGLDEPDDFLKVKETLTRIGVASRKDNKLFQANKYAIEIPLETATLSLEVIKLSVDLIEYGNTNSVTDAEVASEVGLAGVRGGCMNVMINISGLENIDEYYADIQHKIDSLNDEANDLYKKAFNNTKKIIS